ncbi:glycine cleavage system aminomethyltransferase GcvT [Haematospirillum jordaniae]|uniref:glycine cleavage system aminomethyltransferase GcvT n=1 Tax=Haematospirillum jordaniae TaxID=1549855 RepID=UPI0009EE7DC7|nr:glycine cleavage system aminomethyltransferase GcvT [Haematospirillum jordaniae]NKD45080.1 glycine cleavage system aminomethyltransferase GcvT [Haematospirillum jordaniae]NKD57101.1 glycine cleavage system aminomethyltransferase GcvT [Haematospirillum jordaniae]NKD59334.1 glycine cleavage system aminomethyltransferase GcvT [Haematospirillum jordaniae]NKD67027.1 glycine cleavage system aminomethyltransferase GcvT [Haematospirillum jordaniae]NKD79386.1 glycine cleavage system aminomethyltrans
MPTAGSGNLTPEAVTVSETVDDLHQCQCLVLDGLHRSLGARMGPFSGYTMPLHYEQGILAEHLHCRRSAALFDVSHMGQAVLSGRNIAEALETICPGSLKELKPGRQRYTLVLNDRGGILDDIMVANMGAGGDGQHRWLCVTNAGNKQIIFPILESLAGPDIRVTFPDRILLALQGPRAGRVLSHFAPAAASMVFMDAGPLTLDGIPCFVTRSGYTGEDGFEISAPTSHAERLMRHLLEHPDVNIAGLGARDTLRLEAGLPLHGADITPDTTPVEADLTFAIGKRRRSNGGFPGADIILSQIQDRPPRLRVGILPEGRAPARAGTVIQAPDGTPVGTITSGSFSPTLERPIAMGYVDTAFSKPGTNLNLLIRGRTVQAHAVKLPFVAHRYHRG